MVKKLSFLFLFFSFLPVFGKEKPNIIYIMTDDHSYQTFAAYGGHLKDVVKTPNLDSIAQNGMLFERCYVTNSLCGPARASILTGKHSHANGFYANSKGQVFDGSQTTFPKILQKNNYQTAIVGKWHLVSHPTGFDFWEVLTGQGEYYNPTFIQQNGKKIQRKGYNSDIIADKALEFIDKRDPNKPFMLMVHFKGVHSEWEPALRHANLYDNTKFPVPETFFDDYATRASPAKNQEMMISKNMEDYRLRLDGPPKTASAEEKDKWRGLYAKKDAEFFAGNPDEKEKALRRYQRYMQNYCATLYGVDENVGRILKYLKDNNLEENTIVVYTSDQGFYMGEHGWYDKRFMYEESFRTPFVISWKGRIPSGTRNKVMVQNLDFAETILDLAGCEIPQEMQGLSFKEVLFTNKEPKDWRKSIYYRYYEWPAVHMVMRHDGVIMGEEKLIDFYPIGQKEYYNLSDDKNELRNRIDDASASERVKVLEAELRRLRKFYKAPEGIENEPYEREILKEELKKLGLKN